MIEHQCEGQISPVGTHQTSGQLMYVQTLRFLAAASVVTFHSLGTAMKYFPGQNADIASAFRYGDHGVDIFFVISGFIICYSTYFTTTTPTQFLWRRLQRIVPLYWFYTFAMVALAFLAPRAFADTDWINLKSVLLSMTFLSFTQEKMPIVFVGWSLEYEMLFYFTVTILLFRARKVWDDLIVVFSLLTILKTASAIFGYRPLGLFLTNPMLLEFVYGVFVAKLFIKQPIAPLAVLAIVAATLTVFKMDPTSRTIIVGLPASLLVFIAAILSKKRQQASLYERVLGVLGDASYSIYLVHIFIISATLKGFTRFGTLPIDLAIFTTTVVAVIAGYLSFIWIERPSLQFFRHLGTGYQFVSAPALRQRYIPLPSTIIPPETDGSS
jgi:exopolysaccharide production protein ExoZ